MALRDTYILEIETGLAQRNISTLNTSLNNLNGVGGRLRGTFTALAGAAAAFGGVNLAQNAIDQFTAYESLNTQLVTYLGSQEAATSEMERLKNLANSLPQDLNDVATAFTILTRTGVDTSSESLTAFSNIATANAKSLEQLAEAVADGMTGEFERFKEFGIKVSKEGDTLTATLGDQQVAVANSASELIDQLIALGEEGGRFGGAAAANADTLSQSFSNLQGALFEASIAFGEGIKPGLQEVTQAITTLITENSGLIESFGRLIGDALSALPGLFTALKDAVAPLEPVFSLLGTILTDIVGPALRALFEILGAVAEAIAPIVESAIPAMQAGFEGLVTIVQTIIEWFDATVEALGRIMERAREMKESVTGYFSDMGDSISQSASDAYNGVTGWFGDMYDYVVGNSVVPDMVRDVLNEFDFMNTGLGQSMSGIFNTVTSWFSSIMDRVNSYVGSLRSSLSNIGSTLSSGISNLRLPSFGGIGNSISGAFSGLKNMFAGFFADGGIIPSGQFGVVGESGPEFVSGPATVTPMNNQAVNYYINAVDAPSFRALIARDPAFIHAVVQKGAKGIVGVR